MAWKKILVESVSFSDTTCITLFRRILAYLSSFPDHNIFKDAKSKSVTDLFSTISIRNLSIGVLSSPNRKNRITDSHYLQLSKVLIALSNMSFDETKSAPFIIMDIKDNRFYNSPNQYQLALIIKELVGTNYNIDDFNCQGDCDNYVVRITDAGYSFMLNWLPSFSFIASLYCYTIPPLFFLKDVNIIEYVIDTVYKASIFLCKQYEDEASSFCGDNNTLKQDYYLPKDGERYLSFKESLIELHTRHLLLYKDYLNYNYTKLEITKNEIRKLISYIDKYISKYYQITTDNGASECF